MFFRSKCPRSPNAAKTFRSLPRTLLRSIGTSGAPRTRKYPESAPKPINCWRHMAGREMFGNSKMPSNGRSLWELPPTFCRKTCRKRSDRLRIRRFPAKVYMSGNLLPFRNRSSRECSAKPAAIVRKPHGGSAGIRIHSAADARNSAWNEFQALNESGCTPEFLNSTGQQYVRFRTSNMSRASSGLSPLLPNEFEPISFLKCKLFPVHVIGHLLGRRIVAGKAITTKGLSRQKKYSKKNAAEALPASKHNAKRIM